MRTCLGGERLPAQLAVDVGARVLAGLHYAHERRDDVTGASLGIVHRDVTASNVFVTFRGEVKLLDFGLAKRHDRERRTEHGIVKGSFAYLSPDHVTEPSIDRRADVFAPGVLLRELLTGKRLCGDASDAVIVRRLLARDVPWFASLADEDEVPAELRRICAKAMAANRVDRYPTADMMRRDLDAWLDAAPLSERSFTDLFARELAAERDRVACLLRAHPPLPPPVPVMLPTEDLVDDPSPLRRPKIGRALLFAMLGVVLAGVAVDATSVAAAVALCEE